ncbi:MAG: hypothetical protein HOO06_10130 [Bdellovibrionaceae bacterium]|nr:hypothetical protein [Pseudobdellovibrionaceae bacterium]
MSEKQNIIELGSHVMVTGIESNQDLSFHIVVAKEADVRRGKVSNVSPLGQALLGQASGIKKGTDTLLRHTESQKCVRTLSLIE